MQIREAAIRSIESEIVAKEGRWHVGGHYYADESDAHLQRRREAEKRLRKYERDAEIARNRDAVIKKALDRSDPAAERAKRAELFATDPDCSYCGFPIERLSLALAILYNASRKWGLVHVMPCGMNAVLAENVRLAALCAWWEKPITARQSTTEIAGRYVHDVPCLTEFDAFTTPASEPLEGIHPDQEAA